MGKTYLEEAIHREAAALVDDFKKNPGTNKNFPKSINVAVLNVVWQMVASESHFIFIFFLFSSMDHIMGVPNLYMFPL